MAYCVWCDKTVSDKKVHDQLHQVSEDIEALAFDEDADVSGPEPEPPVVQIRMECCGQFDERDPFMHVCVVRG